ncbi:MAG TPA: hypothetical protein VKG21_04605 [Casimicrobiaceae bacterium]|nr:hypothetical protein [Casimicrobiaceae bacterium]
MRIHQATLEAAVTLSSVASPTATIFGALLFAGLAGWARASASAALRRRDGQDSVTVASVARDLIRKGSRPTADFLAIDTECGERVAA